MATNHFESASKLIDEFERRHKNDFESVAKDARRLMDICQEIGRSWSGSFAGWHGRMYFRDFQKPTLHEQFDGEWGGLHGIPDGWEEKDAPAVEQKIDQVMGNGFSVKSFEDKLENLGTLLGDLKADIEVELSAINFDELPKEKALWESIEQSSLGKPKVEYINANLPKTMMSRDSEAMRQGMCIPSWIYYAGVAHEGEKVSEFLTNFRKQITRLAKQMETRVSAGARTSPYKGLDGIHEDILAKCADLYVQGAYAEAVEKSFKVVRDRLRKLTGYETGSEAFGKGKLHIKGAAASNVDADFNKGVQFLMMAIDMFRNEKSHTSDAKIDDPARAYRYLALSSLALSFLDNAEIRP